MDKCTQGSGIQSKQGVEGGQETLIAKEMTFYSWLSPFIGLEPSATQLETKTMFRYTYQMQVSRTQSLSKLQRAPGYHPLFLGREGQLSAPFAQLQQLIYPEYLPGLSFSAFVLQIADLIPKSEVPLNPGSIGVATGIITELVRNVESQHPPSPPQMNGIRISRLTVSS